ncbi:MAG: Fur family transcriptional regulator [Chloroflexota bacterium]
MDHKHLDYAARIRESGYKLTPQRQIILDTLYEMGGHVPVTALVEAVQQTAPAIDRTTVYRTMNLFSELGLVVGSDMDGAAVVEITPQNLAVHSHIVCRECGHVAHVPDEIYDELRSHLLSDFGFSADLDNLTIEGVCHECLAQSHS